MNSILLVDSETIVAAGLQSTLNNCGFDVEVADSEETARARLQKTHFDLIRVDFDLSPRPHGDVIFDPSTSARGSWSGTGLIRELRASGVTSPILVHTVLEGELYETASLDTGPAGIFRDSHIVAFLTKGGGWSGIRRWLHTGVSR
jgi:CheY-like chemotaxis protein